MLNNWPPTNRLEDLIPGNTYHIYNKALSSDKLFICRNDYIYFLQKVERYILKVADLLAYCLIPNHFHLLINIKEIDDINIPGKYSETPDLYLIQVFSNFFNSYTRSFNNAHKRAGRLFLHSFYRILVDNDDYLVYLINYIHQNPKHHYLSKSLSDWKYSSYYAIISNSETLVNRKLVLSIFGSVIEFITYHYENPTKSGISEYLLE